MVHKGLEKSLNKFDDDLNSLVNRFEVNPIERGKTP